MDAEEWDPEDYAPDLNGPLKKPPPSVLTDRQNAAIFYALEGFHGLIAEYELSIGRELTATEKYTHIQRFEGHLKRAYGHVRPDDHWLARHNAWQGRHGGGF